MIIDGFVHQLPDIDPAETRSGSTRSTRSSTPRGKTRARFLMSKLTSGPASARSARRPRCQHAVRQHDPDRRAAVVPRRRVHRAAHPGLHPLERRGHGRQGQQAGRRHRRPPRRRSPRRPRSTRSASTTSSGARTTACAGDHVYIQGHAAPGIYARAFLEGRLDESQLDNFRREIGGGGPVVSYPHPWLMPDFWEFPTVSMGLGPINSIYQARFNQYLHNRRIDDTSGVAGVVLPRRRRERRARDARLDLARRPRAARQPHLGRQLQPAAPRRSGARQRQDHPGARGHLPGRRLERHQGHLGLGVGRAARPRRRRRAARQDEHHRRRRVPALRGRVDGAYIREHFFGPDPRLRKLVEHLSDDDLRCAAPRRSRLQEALRRLQGRHRAARARRR